MGVATGVAMDVEGCEAVGVGGSLGVVAAEDGCDALGVSGSAPGKGKRGTGGSWRHGGAVAAWGGLGVATGVAMDVEGCEAVGVGGSLGVVAAEDGCDALGVSGSAGNWKRGTGGSCRCGGPGAARGGGMVAAASAAEDDSPVCSASIAPAPSNTIDQSTARDPAAAFDPLRFGGGDLPPLLISAGDAPPSRVPRMTGGVTSRTAGGALPSPPAPSAAAPRDA